MPTEVASRTDNFYWLTRQWMYKTPVARLELARVSPQKNFVSDRSGRPLNTDDRHPIPADAVVDPNVLQLLARGGFDPLHRFSYEGNEYSMRPMTAKLLERIWSASGKPVSLEVVCRHLWGRPVAPSYSTFHMTICRANIALKSAGCPLRLKSRLNQVLFYCQQ